MGTPYDAVGLSTESPDEFHSLFSTLYERSVQMGSVGDLTYSRWQDPSGVRVSFIMGANGHCYEVTPTIDAPPGADLRGLTRINDRVISAGVFDRFDEQCTALTLTLEDGMLFPYGAVVDCRTTVVALALDVGIFDTADEFQRSPASLLAPEDENAPPVDPPPPIDGFPVNWPLRVSSESFFSYGVFGDPATAGTSARLAGTVGDVSTRPVEITGQQIHVARLRTNGFEVTACLPASTYPNAPRPGMTIAGEFQLTGFLKSSRSTRSSG